jgi:hypothetical protein
LNLAGNTYNGKNAIPLFVLFLKGIGTKIFTFKDFPDFLTVDQIFGDLA